MGFNISEYTDLIGIGLTAEEISRAITEREEKKKKPFKPHKMHFSVNEYRRDNPFKDQKPIARSRYAEELFKIGAGWNE